MSEKRYYIAYGSNLNVRQMRFRCPSARVIGTAELDNSRLLFKGSKTGSYLTVEPCESRTVSVAVWEVTPGDEAALDRYEGFPRFYYKKELEIDITGIKSGKIRRRKAFVYIMREDSLTGLPTPSYFRTCLEGYRTFGFDEAVLIEALKDSREEAV